MPSEYIVALCFVRPSACATSPFPDMEAQMSELFPPHASIYIDRKQEDGMDIAVAEISGLSVWESEQDVITHLEAGMLPDSLQWLGGYRIQVIPKEDAGACCLKKRG